jgi:tRNA 2-thiouridine synthesizing protein A
MNPTSDLDPSIRSAEGGRLAAGALPSSDAVVDAIGLLCPLPIVRAAERARGLAPGAVLELRADDPVTRVDLPNWCRGQGHRFLGWTLDGRELRLFFAIGRSAAERAE